MNPEPQRAETAGGRERAVQVLLDASSLLLATGSQDAVLSGILDMASRVLAADAFAVWRQMDGDGMWRAVATRGLSASYRTEITNSAPMPSNIVVIPDTRADDFVRAFRDIYETEGIRSLLIAPLALSDGKGATITFYWRQPHEFTAQDVDYGAALANVSAAALNQNELYLQAAREQERLTFLAEASEILSSSLDYETTLHRVAQLAVPRIADWCTVHVVENGKLTRLVVAHADPSLLEMTRTYAERYPEIITPERGLGRVLATGEPEIFPVITDAMVAAAARDPEHLEMLRSLQLTSSILVALRARGESLGAIRLLAGGPANRYFTPADVRLAEDLARRAGGAIENARLHRAVLEQESELRLTHAAARMGSWRRDLVNNTVSWSREFRLLHGLPEDTPATIENGYNLIHPEDREQLEAEMHRILASGSDHMQIEHRSLTPDGRMLWVQSRGTIQRDAAGKPVAMSGITLDVTESRLAEEVLRRTEKLAAAGRLAATVAHEVNNPLESLTNLIFLARTVPGLPEDASEYLSTAEGELTRIAHIVRQTLGFYRESATPKPIDLSALTAEVTTLYQSRAESRSVRLTNDPTPPAMVVANAGEINQVLANLIANAIDATPAGGSVHTAVHQQDDALEITVADTGSGISPANLARVFEPFFTTKAEVGTGLGLWVSRGIAEKHGGTLTLTSSNDPARPGTTATVRLPVPPRD